VLVRFCLVPLL
jgi:hypothetical protein